MKVHIIIISYKRHHLLERCLLSLKNIIPLQAQIYVLINGEDPESSRVAEHKFDNFIPISVFKRARQSLSEARNFLLTQLPQDMPSQDWILFLDDDAYLPDGYGQRA